MKKKGTSIIMIDSAGAGDIISVAGLTSPSIGHTVANIEVLCVLISIKKIIPNENDTPLLYSTCLLVLWYYVPIIFAT